MEILKQIGISLLVTLVVILLAIPAALSLEVKSDITRGAATVVPARAVSVKVLSEEESRSLDIFQAPNTENTQSIVVGSYWRCEGDSEVTTICDFVLVACTNDQRLCVEL